ncbi:MAG: hypothetical protein RLZZ502_1041 [Pseudomonadota bacterium]|jgi:predicted transcriptional regulator
MSAIADKSFNVRLPVEISSQLQQLVHTTGRSKSFHAVAALRSYLDTQAWQIQDIKEGIAEADAGEFASDEEVQLFLNKYER